MIFNKSTILSLTLATSTVFDVLTFVDAAPRFGKSKSSKRGKSSKKSTDFILKCSKSGKSTLPKKAERIRNKYDFYENTEIITDGLYQVLDPVPPLQLGTSFFFSDELCPEDVELECLERCFEANDNNPGCTTVNVIVNLVRGMDRDFFPFLNPNGLFKTGCIYSKFVENAQAAAAPFPRFPVNFTKNAWSLRSVPSLLVYDPAVLVAPVVNVSAGSADWNKFISPAVGCVGSKNGTAPFELALTEICSTCINTATRVVVEETGRANDDCGAIANFICADGELFGGEDSKCSDVCFGCDKDSRIAALVSLGQAITFVSPGSDSNENGCLVRGIFDPQVNGILPDFTCPPGVNEL